MGLGLAASYIDASVKLHLCEEFKIVDNTGECSGKKEIDSASTKVYLFNQILHINLWERKTKSSKWSFGSLTTTTEAGKILGSIIKNTQTQYRPFHMLVIAH